eukprot:14596551-Alexandrium_andersonii.AAC.1
MGWPVNQLGLEIPAGMRDSALRTMTGNMIATPVIGLLLASILWHVDLSEETDPGDASDDA